MEKQRLLETLQQLHGELAQNENIDDETLDELEQLTDQLKQALAQRGRKASAEVEPATSGLRDLLLRYEADHPHLSAAVGRVADALAAMGF